MVAGARDLTASYVAGREQFGRKLAEFQAVAQQVADVYIASRTITLAADNAAWRIAEGLDVTDDLAVAAYWTTTQGPAALRTCHHLHGGMGVDRTYPLHRYFSRITDIAHALDASATDVRIEDPAAKNLELSADQRALKARLRDYFAGLVTHEDHRGAGHGAPVTGTGRRTRPWCAASARTAGWASAGRGSTAATGSARSSRRSSPTRHSAPTCTCRR